MSRHRGLVVLVATGLLAVAGCTAPWDDNDEVRAAVEQTAAALTAGTPDKARFAGDSPAAAAAYDAIVAGLETTPTVSVTDVSAGDGEGRARLAWSWEVGSQTWEYASEAAVVRDGQEWRTQWAPSLVAPGLEAGDRLQATREAARRGDVLGAGGEVLVRPRPVVRVGVSKEGLGPRAAVAAAREVAALADVAVGPYVRQVRAAGDRAFVEAIVYRATDLPAARRTALEAVDGALLVADTLPLAPTRDFAAALLGTVGQATAEIVEDSDGRVRAGDEVGVSGLQLRYDAQLAGTPGVTVERVPAQGEPVELFAVAPEPGAPLRTTLDRRLQGEAQRVVSGIGPGGRTASGLVALRPSTGQVLAAASGPGSEGYGTATFGQYAPGSTFKVVSSLALLRSGLTPTSTVPCTSTVAVDGREFENYDDYPASGLGPIPLRTAVANSCNTAFISQAGRLGRSDLGRAAAALGLGVDHDVGFPAFFGQVPPAESATGAAADMIGQGTVLASPLAMATVMASVVAGRAVLPQLLPDVEVEQTAPRQPLTRAEADALRGMLRGVVTEGSGSVLAGLPGPPILAKTGTAEYGEGAPLPTHAWMVAAQGDLAVAAFVETGESGSGTAGPLLRDFLAAAR